MNRWLSSAAVTLAAVAMIGVAQPAAAAPPDSVGGSFEVAGICPFTVLVEIEGKAKTIERPDGSFILTSPGLVATVTDVIYLGQSLRYHLESRQHKEVVAISTDRGARFAPGAPVRLTWRPDDVWLIPT